LDRQLGRVVRALWESASRHSDRAKGSVDLASDRRSTVGSSYCRSRSSHALCSTSRPWHHPCRTPYRSPDACMRRSEPSALDETGYASRPAANWRATPASHRIKPAAARSQPVSPSMERDKMDKRPPITISTQPRATLSTDRPISVAIPLEPTAAQAATPTRVTAAGRTQGYANQEDGDRHRCRSRGGQVRQSATDACSTTNCAQPGSDQQLVKAAHRANLSNFDARRQPERHPFSLSGSASRAPRYLVACSSYSGGAISGPNGSIA
jgi:hypothetical protein